MVKTYSLTKDEKTKLSDNFTVAEFACKDGSDRILIDSNLVEILQKIRNHFSKPLILTSAYRNAEYNRKIGGVSNSQHVLGKAADIYIQGTECEDIAKYAEYLMPKSGGIGLYGNFVHIDVRANRSRWTNFGTERVVDGFPGFSPDVTAEITAADAVAILTQKGIIASPGIWYEGTWTDTDFKQLLIKTAKYIRDKEG